MLGFMKHVCLQTSIQLAMDLGALRLYVCNHVGKISKRLPRLFQWFLTVVKSLKRTNGIQSYFMPTWFNSTSEIGCIWWSLVLLPWDFLRKTYLPAESNLSSTSDNKWYDDCKERGHCRLDFLHQFTRHVKAHDNICLLYTKLHALSYGFKLSLFWGGLSLYVVWCIFQYRWILPY